MPRHTNRRRDADYLLRRYAEATRNWTVGEPCLSYDGRFITAVKEIDGDLITLDTGERMHRSHMRPAPKEVTR